MPITQEPTLTPIDTDHNQFQVQFGLKMVPGEAALDVTVPNLVGLTQADMYLIDFAKVNTPARGNFPAFRSFQLVLQTVETGPGPTLVGGVYLVNPRTSQLLAILAPPPDATNGPSLVMMNVPFHVKSNQQILVYRAQSSECTAYLSGTAFTFDSDSFVYTMQPA